MIAPWLAAAWRSTAARLAAGTLPHALLVSGPAGLGKRAFAEALAAALLCTARREDGHGCGACRGCQLLRAGTHPDWHRIGFELNERTGEPRSEIVIDQIRRVSERLAQTSQFGGYRVALIEPADAMNVAAANALLKTLEEPSPGAVLVLVADQPMRLPATIRSRCQRIDARFPARGEARAWLAAQGVNETLADELLDLCAGNPGLALQAAQRERRALLDSVAKDLRDLGARRVMPMEMAQRWVREDAAARLALAAELTRLAAWRHAGLARANPAVEELARLTARADFHKLAAWWERANRAREWLKTPLRPDLLVLEVLRDLRELCVPGA